MAKKIELRPVMVRLPESLRRQLERIARENGRSMNAEIIQLLQRAIKYVGPSGSIPAPNRGEVGTKEGGGTEFILNMDGRLMRFVSEDTLELIGDEKKHSSPPEIQSMTLHSNKKNPKS